MFERPEVSFQAALPRAELLRRMKGERRFVTTEYGRFLHTSDGFFVVRGHTSREQWRRPVVRVSAEARGDETQVTVRSPIRSPS